MVLKENNLRRIQSFVVFDLETTGLHARTRITEIGLVAAFREHIRDANNSTIHLPRVLHKLNLCVYPNRLIHPGAYNVTGLDNALLQEQKPFDCDVFNILESFLRRLPPPVCLVAHNGDRFDFPVLQAELKRINKVLPDDVMCADSLICFRELLAGNKSKSLVSNGCNNPTSTSAEPEPTVPQLDAAKEKNLNSGSSICSELGIYPLTKSEELEDEYDGVLFNLLENYEKESDGVEGSVPLSALVKDDAGADLGVHVTSRTFSKSSNPESRGMLQINETTPKRNAKNTDPQKISETIITDFASPGPSLIQQQNETTPERGTRSLKMTGSHVVKDSDDLSKCVNTTPCRKRIIEGPTSAVRKRLNFSTEYEVGGRPKSFKLVDVYQFLNGREPENAHTADGDALNLLECITAVGNDFLEWTDANAHRLCEVVPRN